MPGSANGMEDYWTAKAALELGQKDKAKIYAKQAKAKLGETNPKVIKLLSEMDMTDELRRKMTEESIRTRLSSAQEEEAAKPINVDIVKPKEEAPVAQAEETTQTPKYSRYNKLGKFVGRLMFAAFWISTGIWILQEAETYGKDLTTRYTGFHTFVQTNYNQTLPSPAHLETNQLLTVQVLAIFQIAMGVLSAIAVPLCPLLLSILLTLMTLVWNNPLQYSSMVGVYANCGSWIMNVAMIGAGLLMCFN